MTHEELVALVEKVDRTEEESTKLKAHVEAFKAKVNEVCQEYHLNHVTGIVPPPWEEVISGGNNKCHAICPS